MFSKEYFRFIESYWKETKTAETLDNLAELLVSKSIFNQREKEFLWLEEHFQEKLQPLLFLPLDPVISEFVWYEDFPCGPKEGNLKFLSRS